MTTQNQPKGKAAPEAAEVLTYRLNCGQIVLARLSYGEPYPVTYANRTQAEKAVSKLGEDWYVFKGMSRPFFAAKRTSIFERNDKRWD